MPWTGMLTFAPAAGSMTAGSMASTLHDEPAVQHAHPAGEIENARLFRRQLDRRLLEGGEELADSELRDHDLLRATGSLLAVEDQAHGQSPFHLDLGRHIAALNGDR